MTKEFYHDIDINANQLFNSRLHNITTAARIILGGSLGIGDKGYQVYDIDLLTPYFWDGVAWQSAGGSGTVWGSITGNITDQTDLTLYLSNNYYPLSSNPAGYLTSETDPVFTAWLNGPPDISEFNNDLNYISSIGSGTTNYITKWTSPGLSLGDSQIYDNGTNIGIGHNTPVYKLDVLGTIHSSSIISAVTSLLSPILNGGALTTSTLTLSGTNQVSDASTIYIQPNAGSILVGKTSGTTSGTFKVVYRDTAGSTLGSHFGIYNNEIATINKGASIAFGDNAGNNIRGFIKGAFAGTGSGGYLALSTNSSANTLTEALRINYTQNVLIGTVTDSGYKLDVNGTARVQSSLTLGSSLYANGSEGTSGQVLVSGGTGASPSWTTLPSTTGYVPYTGATSDVNLGEWGLSQLGYAQFDITPSYTTGAVGKMVWNDTDGTLDLGLKGGNVTLQLGQEQVARVVNKTSPLVDLLEANYQVCLVTGATGQRLSVRLAQADSDANSAGTLGVVTETILKNQEGFITISGQIHEINTTGALQGETWTDGDILYLSPTTAGAITNIKPTAPQHSVIIGYVEYAHAIHGKIFVKIDNGYELGELHNVYVPTPSNKDGIFWSTANSRYENNSIAGILGYTPADDSGVVHITGTETITGAKTFSTNNVRFGTTIFDVTNNRLTYSGATGASRINLPDAGTTLTDGINWGDIAVYRGSASTLYIGQIGIATRHLRIGIQAGIVNLAASGSSATPVLNLSTTQSGSSVLGIGGTDNNVTIAANTLTGSMATAALSISQTWNTTGNPTAILLNITNTAVGALARLMDLQVGGVSRFFISSGGGVGSNGFYIGPGTSIRGFTMSGASSLVIPNQVGFQDASSITQTTNHNYTCFSVAPTFNITGTGITRGIYINPTLTSANDFRAFDAANGSIVLPYTGQTTTYAIKTSDHLINCTSGTFTATLPTAVGCTGKHYTIKNSGSGAITIATTSSQTIDGSITYSLGSQYKYVRLVSDGANWIIIGNN